MIHSADRLSVAQEYVLSHIRTARQKNERRSNLRSQIRDFTPEPIVYVRSFAQSNAIKYFSAKLAPKFTAGRVRAILGNVALEIDDMNGKLLGTYHMKDIKT